MTNWFLKTLLAGHKPTPELLAILLVYLVQGVLGIARLAVSFFLKDSLGLSPAQVSALLGIAALPWIVKPLFGLFSDSLPLWGYHRRSYLILAGLLGCCGWLALATLVRDSATATLVMVLCSLSVAVGDVIVDALVVERARHESTAAMGSLQSLCWGASAVGSILTAYLSGLLLLYLTPNQVFLLTAGFPLLTCGSALLISDRKSSGDGAIALKPHLRQLRQALSQKSILLPTLFLFLWQATPSADSAFFFFSTNELGFTPEFLGQVRMVGSIASLVGIWLFQRFLKDVPFRVIFGWGTVLSSLLGLSVLLLVTHTNRALGIDDHWFSLGDRLVLTVMSQIAYMPVLVLAARLCPPGIEATLFALLMSVSNGAGLVSHELGALLTHWLGITEGDFSALGNLVVIANLSALLPLAFLGWLPASLPETRLPLEQLPESPRAQLIPN